MPCGPGTRGRGSPRRPSTGRTTSTRPGAARWAGGSGRPTVGGSVELVHRGIMPRRRAPQSLTPDRHRVGYTPRHDGWGRGPARRSREALRRLHGGGGDQPRHALGRVLLAARPVRLRQDHHAADDRRVRAPSEGQILLDGVDMAQTPPHKRNVNTVFQNYALFPHLTVAENVAFGLRYKDVSKAETKERVGDALELVAADRLRQAPAQPALRRPAAARRAGASPHPQPRGAAAGRAARRPRREAPQAAADRVEGAAGGGRASRSST